MKRILALLPDNTSKATIKQIKKAFGPYAYGRITWETVLPEGCLAQSKAFRVNLDHVVHSIVKHRPNIIITFGNSPKEAAYKCTQLIPVWPCHHPNARFRTEDQLAAFAARVNKYLQDGIEGLPVQQAHVEVIENSWRCGVKNGEHTCILPKNHGLWHFDGFDTEWK